MKRTLSSFTTLYAKLAILWTCAALGVPALLGLVRPMRILENGVDRPTSLLEDLSFFVMWASVSFVFGAKALRLRRVRLDHGGLLISDYRRQIFVPFEDIGEVEHIVMRRAEEVVLNFRRETALGWSATFVPAGRGAEIVAELHRRVPQATILEQGERPD